MNESFDLRGPAGRLEAMLMYPAEAARAAAVLCHAHPLHGGMMHFKLLFRVAKALQDQGLAVLRFNFRGVGRSEGVHDHGRGERDDVHAAVDELARRFPALPILAGGFSFGALMALQAGADDERVRALVSLGLPLSHIPDLTFLDACTKPRLFVQGEQDPFGAPPAINAVVTRLPEPKSLVVVPGADHYFTGHLEEAQASVAKWVAGLRRSGSVSIG